MTFVITSYIFCLGKLRNGFDKTKWKPRTNENHRLAVDFILSNGTAPTKRAELESFFGVRYSVLLKLPYFDVVRMTVIDPMHNLFLGTAKRIMSGWMDLKLLDKGKCAQIQTIVDNFDVPSDVGRIPHKIGSGFASFTADQWKNWTLVFSMVALKGLLPEEHLECWRKFVLACSFMCAKTINRDRIPTVDKELMDFCSQCELLFSDKFITPNMHLHGHLHECLTDFGPIHGFWLFSFERYNGLLGMYNTNKKNIESQIMERFLQTVFSRDLPIPSMAGADNSETADVLTKLRNKKCLRGTLQTTNECDYFKFFVMTTQYFNTSIGRWFDISAYSYGKVSDEFLSDFKFDCLSKMLIKLYGTGNIVCYQSMSSTRFVRLFTNVFGSVKSRSCRSAYILAYWQDGDDEVLSKPSDILRPGEIQTFYLVNVLVHGKVYQHIIAEVTWFQKSGLKNFYGEPIEVWSQDSEDFGIRSFIPVQRILDKFVYMHRTIQSKRVIVVCPLARN